MPSSITVNLNGKKARTMIKDLLPDAINIVEVGPRDGLQAEAVLDIDTKVKLINQLSKSGLKHIESGAFVSPRSIPQMADSAEVFYRIERNSSVIYSALTPNLKGFERSQRSLVNEVAVFTSVSETFCQRNINCSIEQSIERFEPVLQQAKRNHIPVRGYLSCVIDCPFEGATKPKHVAMLTKRLIELGCYQVSLGDTIGTGTPLRVKALIDAVAEEVPVDLIAVHFHDTWGQALTNIYQSLCLGVNTIDSSVAGLGGCPYAPGAAGNVATENVIYLCHGLGIETGVDLNAVAKAGWQVCDALNRKPMSRVSQALRTKLSQ